MKIEIENPYTKAGIIILILAGFMYGQYDHFVTQKTLSEELKKEARKQLEEELVTWQQSDEPTAALPKEVFEMIKKGQRPTLNSFEINELGDGRCDDLNMCHVIGTVNLTLDIESDDLLFLQVQYSLTKPHRFLTPNKWLISSETVK